MKFYPKYEILITYNDGMRTYLTHKDKMAWGKRTATKHYKDVLKHAPTWVDGDKITNIELRIA
jgi:hypothetical protein